MCGLNLVEFIINLSINVLLLYFFIFYIFYHIKKLIFSFPNLFFLHLLCAKTTKICLFFFIAYHEFFNPFANLHVFLKPLWYKFSGTLLTLL